MHDKSREMPVTLGTLPELMSESSGILLVEFCKGHTSLSYNKSTESQEEKPCPTVVDFSRD